MKTTTVANLRRTLAAYFDEPVIYAGLRCARVAGQIPAGTAGRNGCGSAPLDTRQAVGVMLALGCRAARLDPKQPIGAMRLTRRPAAPYDSSADDFLAGLIIDIERCAAGHQPGDWSLAFHAQRRGELDWNDRNKVRLVCELPSKLLADIAALFRADRGEAAA
jgi:hypothetical protein